MKKIAVMIGVLALALPGLSRADLWINEFHYDNAGGDVGEFVEVAISDDDPTALSDITLTLYNGGTGAAYDSETADNFVLGLSTGGFTFYTWSPTSIQNGSPDGISLDISGTIVTSGTTAQFLSYEGSFVGSGGPAGGLTSTDVGVSESGVPIGESLQLTGGPGSNYDDFTWAAPAVNTLGRANTGQSFAAIPEPSTFAFLLIALGVLGVTRHRRS